MSGESLRGPIWEEMRERLGKVHLGSGQPFDETLDKLATVAAEFMAGRIGSIARNAQPMIDSAVEDARIAGLKQGWGEGLVAGKSITMRRMSDEPKAPEPQNPYEEDEDERPN